MPDPAEVKARLRAQIAAIEASPPTSKKPACGAVSPIGDAGVPEDACISDGDTGASCEAPRPSRTGARAFRDADGYPCHPCEASGFLREGEGLRTASSRLAGPHGDDIPLTARAEASAADDAERAFRKIERLALAREQASAALRSRLVREGFLPEAADAAVGRALACGLVDDARYAEVLVRSRLSQGRGAQGIAAELESLGIDASVVPGWPEEFAVDHESEVARALALLDRKPPRAKNKRDAAYRRLVQKGFGAPVASTAARVWSEAQ